MAQPDIVVIGAGPAGLMAARTAAGEGARVLLLEALPKAGDLAHPCSGAIAPVPGFVRLQRQADGLHMPELALRIPPELIVGTPTVQRYVSPRGISFEARFPARDDFAVAVIDKPGLLRLLADQAATAGAELRFGTRVTGLLREDGRVLGVRTRQGEVRAPVVLSAEGSSRQFAEGAGLYEGMAAPKRCALIVSEVLEAPAAREAQQISTLGRRYTTATAPAFGTVVIPRPGRAEVYFSVFVEGPWPHSDETLWEYLRGYKKQDPRISGLLRGACTVRRAGTRMVLRPMPPRVTADGFLGVGDAVGPGGHCGILPCLFLGQQAARAAVQALRTGDLSRRGFAAYERLVHGPLRRGLDTEYRIIRGLAGMTDDELDRICQTLSRLNLAPFFFAQVGPMLGATLGWVVTSPHLILRDWRLLRRVLS